MAKLAFGDKWTWSIIWQDSEASTSNRVNVFNQVIDEPAGSVSKCNSSIFQGFNYKSNSEVFLSKL